MTAKAAPAAARSGRRRRARKRLRALWAPASAARGDALGHGAGAEFGLGGQRQLGIDDDVAGLRCRRRCFRECGSASRLRAAPSWARARREILKRSASDGLVQPRHFGIERLPRLVHDARHDAAQAVQIVRVQIDVVDGGRQGGIMQGFQPLAHVAHDFENDLPRGSGMGSGRPFHRVFKTILAWCAAPTRTRPPPRPQAAGISSVRRLASSSAAAAAARSLRDSPPPAALKDVHNALHTALKDVHNYSRCPAGPARKKRCPEESLVQWSDSMHKTLRPFLWARRPARRLCCAGGHALFAARPARAGGPASGRRISAQQRLEARPGGQAGAARHAADVLGALARRQVPAGAERRLPAAHRDRARRGFRRGAGPASAVPDAWLGLALGPGGTASMWAAARRLRSSNSRSPTARWRRRRTFPVVDAAPSARRRISSAMWRFRRMAACSTPPTCTDDSVAVINPQSGMVINRVKTGRRPYRILFHPDGKSFFVTHWADGTLGHYDANDRQPAGAVPHRRASHRHGVAQRRAAGRRRRTTPTLSGAPVRRRRQYQQRLRRGRDAGQGSARHREHQHFHDAAPAAGHDASALALAPMASGSSWPARTATWSAVVDISSERSRCEGFIPTGWYPTAVRVLPSGTLVVLNGKGAALLPESATARTRPSDAGACTPEIPASGRATWPTCRPARPRGSTPSPTISWTAWTTKALAQLGVSRREAGRRQSSFRPSST